MDTQPNLRKRWRRYCFSNLKYSDPSLNFVRILSFSSFTSRTLSFFTAVPFRVYVLRVSAHRTLWHQLNGCWRVRWADTRAVRNLGKEQQWKKRVFLGRFSRQTEDLGIRTWVLSPVWKFTQYNTEMETFFLFHPGYSASAPFFTIFSTVRKSLLFKFWYISKTTTSGFT